MIQCTLNKSAPNSGIRLLLAIAVVNDQPALMIYGQKLDSQSAETFEWLARTALKSRSKRAAEIEIDFDLACI